MGIKQSKEIHLLNTIDILEYVKNGVSWLKAKSQKMIAYFI